MTLDFVKIISVNIVSEENKLSNFLNIHEYGMIQEQYCKKIENFYNDLYPNRKKLAYVRTYGCQQNVSDSEKYIGMLLKMGFEITDVPENADVILLNTCAIRENAENKVFGNIGWIKNIKKNNKNLFVIVCGCMTEQEVIIKKIKSTYSFINLVLGTHSIYKFPELFYSSLVKESKNPIFSGDKEDSILEGFPEYKNNKLKAFLSVMYGCNNYCSYCIVPYVRGRERSRKPEQIVSEFKKLLDAGYKDITLLGQNVNSYGKNLEESVDFSDLLKMLDNFDGEYTIRFMTSHPKDASNKLIDTIAASKHIAHHLHLPVQCGSNHILSEMNRKYTKESYMKIIEYARHKIPDIIFTSDIIVGFPGETYEEFLETVDLIKEVKFGSLFTFIYSPREGTQAATLPDNISKEEKTKWLLELLKVQEGISEELHKKMVGKDMKVLVENFDEKSSNLLCRTSGNVIAEVPASKDFLGKFINIHITDSRKESISGTIIKER